MVLRLLRTLPGAPGFLATIISATLARRRQLDTSVGVPEPYDLTVRAIIVRRRPCDRTLAISRGHRSPHSTYRDDAYAPAHEAGWREKTTISDKKKQRFSTEGANGGDGIETICKISFWAQAFSGSKQASSDHSDRPLRQHQEEQ
jgi:hypothetical protein